MPKVTVVIPCHNGEAYIGAAIDSVLAQGHPDLEIVVADDDSSDGSAALVERYGPPVRLLRVSHHNMHATRNAAMAASDSELIALIDQDDVWLQDKLRRQLALLAKRPNTALCYTDAQGIDETGRWIGARPSPLPEPADQTEALGSLLKVNLMAASSVVFRRPVLERVGPFDATYRLAGDWDLWLRIAEEWPIAAVPEVLLNYRLHGANLSRGRIELMRESIAVQESALARIAAHPRWADDPTLRPYLQPARYKLASRYSELGLLLAREGEREHALASHRRALALRPASPQLWLRLLRSTLRPGTTGSGGAA